MSFIKKHFHLLVLICVAFFCLFLFYENGVLRKKLSATKVQNIQNDSEAKQVKINYLQKEIKAYSKSSDSLAALSMRDKTALAKLQQENDRLKKGLHEKYTTITRMSGHQLFDFFAKLDTGSVEGK